METGLLQGFPGGETLRRALEGQRKLEDIRFSPAAVMWTCNFLGPVHGGGEAHRKLSVEASLFLK
jgi:hypothetical protein